MLMLGEIHNHVIKHGNHILVRDNPKQLKYGYICSKTEKIWEYPVSEIRHEKNFPNETT